MYTTGQYMKIVGGKEGAGMLTPDPNHVPPPLAKTCTLYLKAIIDQYLHQPHHYH